MSKKKQKKDPTSFKNDPFKTVKGFCVLPQETETQAQQSASRQALPHPVDEENEVDFSQAMAQLGVDVLAPDDEIRPARDANVHAANGVKKVSPVCDDSDEALFLASLGQLDTVFTDSYYPDDEEQSTAAEARRMKQLRQGKLKPQDTLDLHGCYRDEALKKVRHFLQHCHSSGCATVLIVTGQGKRSPNGEAVLRSDVEQYLRSRASAWVAEWGRAPRQYGGEGALVVFLRQRKTPALPR